MTKKQTSILVRGDSSLHERVLAAARRHQKSINELCCDRLSVPSSIDGDLYALLRKIVGAADATFPTELVGVVFYGSRARLEARDESDWDFLLVMNNAVALNRDLYRRWDDHFAADRNAVEIHFAQLPPSTRMATGFWAEIALDGIILYERDFAISRHLIAVRHDIANGLIMSRKSHGQTYWVYKEVA